MTENVERQEFINRLKASAPTLERIETKRFGTVYMRRQNGADQARYLALQRELDALKRPLTPAAHLAVMLLQSDGEPIFPKPLEGLSIVEAAGAADLDELYQAFLQVIRLDASAVENAEKKSSSSQSGNSGTT